MKVRDCFPVAPRAQTRLPATHCRALVEPDDSRIAALRFRCELGFPCASDREFGLHDSYVRHRPVRQPALRLDSRNPGRNRGPGAGAEIYSLRNFDSVSAAKEYVQAQSLSFAVIERDPRRSIVIVKASSEKGLMEASSPQSSPRKRGEADTHALLTLNVAR